MFPASNPTSRIRLNKLLNRGVSSVFLILAVNSVEATEEVGNVVSNMILKITLPLKNYPSKDNVNFIVLVRLRRFYCSLVAMFYVERVA